MQKETKYIVSLSGGKDSTAMLLRLLEEGRPVDEILFCDTGIEFDAMYRHIDKLEMYIGQPITRLKSNYEFEYLLLEHSGLSSTTQFSIQEAEAFFLILLVYCQGYDPEI